MAGPHKITVLYGGQEVPQSPINIECAETGKSDKCKIGKLNNQSVFSLYDLIELFLASKPKDKLDLGEEGKLVIDAKEAGKGGVTCRITRETSSSSTKESSSEKVEMAPDGTKITIKETRKETTKSSSSSQMSGSQLPNVNVIENGDGTFTVNYKVFEPGNYTLTLHFGGKVIPGGEIKFTVSL